jgi:hypothetical protein
MPLVVSTRLALPEDADFAYSLREATMRGYVEATWGVWNADEARTQITEDITRGRLRIVDVNNRATGMTRVDVHATHIDIDQVFILPEHQRQGLVH